MSCSMPISNTFHFEQFSPGFVIIYTNYCVDSFEHLHLSKDHSPTCRFLVARQVFSLQASLLEPGREEIGLRLFSVSSFPL